MRAALTAVRRRRSIISRRFSHARPVDAIVGAPEIEGRFFYTDDLTALNFTRGRSPLGPFLDRLLRDCATPRPYAMAVQSIPADELLPGFVAENATDLLDAADRAAPVARQRHPRRHAL